MVNWVVYHSIHGRGAGEGVSDDDDEDYFGVDSVEVADNLMRTPRTAIVQQRKKTADHVAKTQMELKEEYAKIDKDKIEATLMGIDASVNAWLNQERSKQNAFVRKKNLNVSDVSSKSHYRWLRKPRFDAGGPAKPGETVYFYDKIANADLIYALVPVFLVFVFLLNLIA